jgi:hypothetical protein
MATLLILSARGDTAYRWDAERAATGDAEAQAAVREAERIFREHRGRGATAFRVVADRPAERIDDFEPKAEQIVIVPRIAGG